MSDTAQHRSDKLLKKSIGGSLIAAVCCFTPLLVLAFTGVGLAGWIGGLDYFLFPMLFTSLGVVAYALYLRAGANGASPRLIIAVLAVAFSALLIWLEFRYALRISLAAVALVAAYGFYLNSEKAQSVS